MARKNGHRHFRAQKLDIPRNHHFIYSVNDDGSDASVVRYLGEQNGDYLTCYMPSGYVMPIHVSQLSNPPKVRAA